jgi:hypothetical protein
MCYGDIFKTDVHFLYYSALHVKIILSRSALRTWKLVHFLYCWSKEVKLFNKSMAVILSPPPPLYSFAVPVILYGRDKHANRERALFPL